MARRDKLAKHWRHPVTIKRLISEGAYGTKYAAATVEDSAIDATTRLVRGPGGAEVVSSATVSMPATVANVPVGSLVTLPPSFGGRTAKVLVFQRADGGGLPTPDHITVNLE